MLDSYYSFLKILISISARLFLLAHDGPARISPWRKPERTYFSFLCASASVEVLFTGILGVSRQTRLAHTQI
ncbi:hypothetical protein GGI42DRAFT_310790 [Trichoderma sp. SZMC 28013]